MVTLVDLGTASQSCPGVESGVKGWPGGCNGPGRLALVRVGAEAFGDTGLELSLAPWHWGSCVQSGPGQWIFAWSLVVGVPPQSCTGPFAAIIDGMHCPPWSGPVSLGVLSTTLPPALAHLLTGWCVCLQNPPGEFLCP